MTDNAKNLRRQIEMTGEKAKQIYLLSQIDQMKAAIDNDDFDEFNRIWAELLDRDTGIAPVHIKAAITVVVNQWILEG